MASPTETLAPMLGLAAAPGFDATTVILMVLAAVAGYLVYDFIREAKGRSSVALVGAVLGHALLIVLLSLDIPGRLGWGADEPGYRLVEFEVAQIDEPEPEPEPEKVEPEEVEPEPIEPVETKPPHETKPPPNKTKKADKPNPDEPIKPEDKAPPKRWDLSQTTQGGNSGVTVEQGSGGDYGGTGKPDSKGTRRARAPAATPRASPTGPRRPGSRAASCSSRTCPSRSRCPRSSVRPRPSSGSKVTSMLKVQIAAEGKIRDVTLVKGIGQGCDQVAIKALKQARFKPAVGTNGKPVDFELRYEYAFTVSD